MQDKIPAGDIKEQSDFLKWLDNFWYHYKVPAVLVLLGVIVLLICCLQTCSGTTSYDMSVLYAGRVGMTQSESLSVSNVLAHALPTDYNGDGKKSIEFTAYNVMSEEQLRKLAAETYEDGDHVYVDRAYYSGEYESYTSMMTTGEYSVCLLEPWLFEKMASAGRLKKLSDVFTELPQGAVGEYGVSLGSTELYAYYEALQVLPEDTVVCLMQPFVIGQSSKEEHYSRCIETFKAIIEFETPNE